MTRLVALFIFALFVLGFVMRSVDWFGSAPGDLGDPRLNSYFLEHVWLWLAGAQVSLWSPTFFYPFSHILGFSDNHFGSVLFYGLFRCLGASREYAFDAWFVVGALLNFLASFWAFRQWRFGLIASALGAFVFSASLPVLMADNAAQLNYRFAIPFAWLMFYRSLTQTEKGQQWLYFGVASLCVAEQFLCSIYLGVLLVYSLGALAIAWWCVNRKRVGLKKDQTHQDPLRDFINPQKKQNTTLLGIALTTIAAFITGALLFQYQQIAREYGLSRNNAEVISMLPKVGSYLLSDHSIISGLWSAYLNPVSQRQEHQLFIGLGPLLFFCVGIYISWNSTLLPKAILQIGKAAFFSIAIVWLITIEVAGYSLYVIVLQLPGVSAIRSVGRVILVLLFPVAILVAVAVQSWQIWLFSKLGQGKSVLMKALVCIVPMVAVLSESIFSRHNTTPLSVWQERMQKMQILLPTPLNPDAIIFVPRQGAQSDWLGELDGMLIAQEMRLPTINGYSGSLPPGYPDLGVSALARFEAYAKLRQKSDDWIQQQLERVVKLKTNYAWLQKQAVTTAWNQTLLTNSENPFAQAFLVEGWAQPEPWGTWILGHDAHLLIPLPKAKEIRGGIGEESRNLPHELVLQVRPFINTNHPQLRATYQVNGSKNQTIEWNIASSSGSAPSNVLRIAISSADLEKGYLDIALHIDNPISPKTLGIGQDERVLGLGLESITLK